jgi:hypothetical protein
MKLSPFTSVPAVSSATHEAFIHKKKGLTLDDMGPNIGPPFGRRLAEKRLELLKIYMG